MPESPLPISNPAEFLRPSFSRGLSGALHAFVHEGWKGASFATCMAILATSAGMRAEYLSREVRACYERALSEKSLPEAPGVSRHAAEFAYSMPVSSCEETSTVAKKDGSGKTYYEVRTKRISPWAPLTLGFLALAFGAAAGYGVGRTILMRRYLEHRYEKATRTHPYLRDAKTREWIEHQDSRLGISPVDEKWLALIAPGTTLTVAGLSCTKGELDLWTCGLASGEDQAVYLNSKKLAKILARVPRAHGVRIEWNDGNVRRTGEFGYAELRRLWLKETEIRGMKRR